jgi:hypothetical protein
MPAITGYYGGYLNALSTISGVEEAQNRIAARNQQMQMAAKQDALDDQTRQTLSTAFSAQQRNGDVLTKFDLEDQTAQQYRNAGKAVMASDPKTGIALMREGDLALHQNQGRRLEAAKVEMIENDRLASLAGMVETQDQLDEYVKLQASKGRVVPREFQTLTPATKAYLERQAFLLDPASKAAGLLFRTKKLELDEAERQRKAEAEKERQAQAERREANRQAGNSLKEGARSLSSVAPKSDMAYQEEINLMTAADPEDLFKKVHPGLQRQAVQDAHMRARQFLQQNPKLTPEDALAEARRSVLAEFIPARFSWQSPERLKPSEAAAARGMKKDLPPTFVSKGVTYRQRTDGSGLYDPIGE